MNLKRIRTFFVKVAILEAMIIAIVFLICQITNQKTYSVFVFFTFLVGGIVAFIGSLFAIGTHNSSLDRFARPYYGSSMSEEESRKLNVDDINKSNYQSSLFVVSGLIAVGLAYLLYVLK